MPAATPSVRSALVAAVRRALSPRWYSDGALGPPPPQHLHIVVAEQRATWGGLALVRELADEIADATARLAAEGVVRADPLAAAGVRGLSPSLDILGRSISAPTLPVAQQQTSLEAQMAEMRLWANSVAAPPRPAAKGPHMASTAFIGPDGKPLQAAFALMQDPNLQRKVTVELCADAALPSLIEASRAAKRATTVLLGSPCVASDGDPVCGLGARVAARTATDAKPAVLVLARADAIQTEANPAVAAHLGASFKVDTLAPAWLLSGNADDAAHRDFIVRLMSASVPSLSVSGRLNERVASADVTAYVSDLAVHALDSVKELAKLRTAVEKRVWV